MAIAPVTTPVATATVEQTGKALSTCKEGLAKIAAFCQKQFSSVIAYAKPFATRSFAYCKANPWQAVGFVVVALVIIGIISNLFLRKANNTAPAKPAISQNQPQETASKLTAEAAAKVEAKAAKA